MRTECTRFLVLVGIIVLLTTGGILGATEARTGGVLRVALDGEPLYLDWQFSTDERCRIVASHIYENLVTLDTTGRVIPQLAESWEVSDDGITYIFTLRRGVLFHNGKEMTAEDVKASFERYLQVARRRVEFSMVESVEVVDTYTIAFRLSHPYGMFLTILAAPINPPCIMPREVVEGRPAKEVEYIGTGPFKFVEWIPDRYVKLVRFEDYVPDERFSEPIRLGGRREAYVDEILFIPVPESGARIAGLLAGEYDFIETVPASTVPALEYEKSVVIDKVMPYAIPFVLFNHANQPTNNLKFRQAIQIALDMEPILDICSDGFYRLDHNLMYPESGWATSAGKDRYNVHDLEAAKRLLAESGYNGEEILFYAAVDYDWMYRGAIVMAEQLRAIGINVRLRTLDYGTIKAIRQDKSAWHLATTGVIPEPTISPMSYVTLFHSGPNNYGFYSNPDMDKLCESLPIPQSYDDRRSIWAQIQQLAYDDVLLIAWGHIGRYNALSARVKGYQTSWVPRFWNVWIEGQG